MEAKLRGIEEKATDILDRLGKISNGKDGNQNVTHVVTTSGSVTTQILAIAFAIVMTVCIGMAFLYLDMNRRIDRMQDHLTAIYMIAPDLHPKNSGHPDLKKSP